MRQLIHSLVALALAGAAPLTAQQSGRTLSSGTAVGVSVGRVMAGNDGIMTVGLRVTQLRRDGGGMDLAVTTAPQVLRHGVIAAAPDVSLAWNLSADDLTFLPKVGLSGILAVGLGDFGITGGVHWGAGAIVRAGAKLGVRLDAVQHRYLGADESVYSISIGLTGLPQAAAVPVATQETRVSRSGSITR